MVFMMIPLVEALRALIQSRLSVPIGVRSSFDRDTIGQHNGRYLRFTDIRAISVVKTA